MRAMTVMTPEYEAILRKDKRNRYNAVRKFIGAKKGDGQHVRYQGAFHIGEGEDCYVFRYWEDTWKEKKIGRNHYVLVNIETMQARWDREDEWFNLMMGGCPMLNID